MIIATVFSMAIDRMTPAIIAESAMRASLSWARCKRRRAIVIIGALHAADKVHLQGVLAETQVKPFVSISEQIAE